MDNHALGSVFTIMYAFETASIGVHTCGKNKMMSNEEFKRLNRLDSLSSLIISNDSIMMRWQYL